MVRLSVITLCNNGYIPYTLNCIETIKQCKSPYELKCFCVGENAYNAIVRKNGNAALIDDSNENVSMFQKFRTGVWSNVVQYKFKIIHEELLTNDYVLYTDGDIVYENVACFDYLLKNIEDNDMLVQNNAMDEDIARLCSGFMFIKSNKTTIDIFNPIHTAQYKNTVGWGDQIYINEVKDNLTYKLLPLDLFPNGKYFYTNYDKITPYIIHFNWVIGHEKYEKMKKHGKWVVDEIPT